MNLLRIELKNFLSHRDTAIDLSGRNPVIVVGENGAGKSALFKDSVTWALFGKSRGGVDDIIMDGESVAAVCIEFSVGNDLYIVERGRERDKKTTLNLTLIAPEGAAGPRRTVLNGATIAETQKKLEQLLGVDYETFVCTACVEQGKADAFSSLTPKEAKQILMRILCLGEYEQYEDMARKAATKFKNEVAAFQSIAESYGRDLTKLQLADTELEILKVKLSATEKSQNDLLAASQAAQLSITTAAVKIEQIKAEGGKVGVQQHIVSESIKRLSTRLSHLSGEVSTCPLCLSALSREHLEQVRTQLTDERGLYSKELERLTQTVVTLSAAKRMQDNSLVACSKEAAKIQVALSNTEDDLRRLRSAVTLAVADAQKLAYIQEKIKKSESTADMARQHVLQYARLDEAFGQDGIPSLIVENVVPEIEVTANAILSLLTDGKMGLRLRTQKALKTGGISDTLDIEIYYLTNSRLYDMMSGGERFRVDLSIRVALSSVLARRNNYRIETLIIDEGLGSLDSIGRQKFVELSGLLISQFKRIIVITHTDVAEMYPDTITIKKVCGVSEVGLQ